MGYEIKLLVTDKVPAAASGMRSVRLGWKTKKDGSKPLSPNKYVHIPVTNFAAITGNVEKNVKFDQFMTELFNQAQDRYIHELVSQSIEDGTGLVELTDTDISIEALVKANEAVSRGTGKLSKDSVKEWFKLYLEDNLRLVLIGQKGWNEVEANMEANKKWVADRIGNYMEYYTKFAGPTYMVQPVLAKKLKEVLELSEDQEQVVYKQLWKKLDDQSVEKTAEDFGI